MPQYNLNFQGSSGFGVLPGGRYGRLTSTPPRNPGAGNPDHAIWDASSGRVVSFNTGQPFSGVDPGTGKNFNNGIEVAPPNPATQPFNERYQPREIIRSPETARAQTDLMEQFRSNASSALQDFNSQLSRYRDDVNAARSASHAATDVAPTVAALQSAQRDYGSSLTTADQRYQAALDEAAARERGIVTQAQDYSGFDTALNNALAHNLDVVRGNVSRYKMGTSTPRSMGSAENAMLMAGATAASVPIELARQQRRYDVLTGLAMPTERDIAGRNIAYAGGFLPGTAASRYGAETGTAMNVQNLLSQAATAGFTNAAAYLQAYGMPAMLQQQILTGQITELEALRQIEEAARYRTVEDTAGMPITQPVSYNMALPGYPSYPTRYPRAGAGPVVVSPGRSTAPAYPSGLDQYGIGIPYRGIPYRGILPEAGITPGYLGPTRYPVSYAHSTPNTPPPFAANMPPYIDYTQEQYAGGVGG